MIKEIVILTIVVSCCVALPKPPPLQKVMAVVVQPEAVKAPENGEVLGTAESGWRNRGWGGGYGHRGGYGYGGGWHHGGGGYRGGYGYGGGWGHRG